ncbi:aminodeoxychorismate synthase, subunit I [Roseovarius nanhaiticus]|uniref:Aminodeoxychorismate synthase, subunit I n=1 Tax=Roseovarius nanhaiticus TaxID=573024 RepID=A0A1N7FZ05_9RHOB|nr:aminodeoxychorismate synthase component I [Roseovarius nanhaiticus]SEK41348.1 aminodeoxychorismate synthase, subunit I [Roseovarius nanhaiticus]SIS05590.1 aminodeoxychorismate synthase, subunit I [Roseovarius nanhaiticus]
MEIRFDQGPDGTGAARFAAPSRIIEARDPADVQDALAALDAARAGGAWLAGYASYELGYALEPRLAPLMPPRRRLPLLRIGVYDAPEAAPELAAGPASLSDLSPAWDAARYGEAFRTVHDFIGAGDIYQANLTFPLSATATGDPGALYAALSAVQPLRYGALVLQEDGPAILSRSPELFFRTDAEGRIETRPMKGTQPRSPDAAEDARRRIFLSADDKNRAENLMIVDLLRNDLSRVCAPGSVTVPELFTVESYSTVHQMTSLIAGQMMAGTGLGDVLAALFPCGSITGAPKLRAMQVLADLEETPREIYCGTIGWAAPDGRAEFNVAIRTLMVEDGNAVLNVGGGVVHDSTAEAEYEEALWKTRFARI